MNEQALMCLEQYDFKVYKTIRVRNGFLCNTSRGVKLLCECTKSDSYYMREYELTENIKDNAEFAVDSYVASREGNLLVENEEGKFYVKNWCMGRELGTDSINDVCLATRLMAYMHIELNRHATLCCDCSALEKTSLRHTRELKSIWNYLKAKKGKNDFELLLYKNFSMFFEETGEFEQLIKDGWLEELSKQRQLSHTCFDHHNILMDQPKPMLLNFDRVSHESNMVDLYRFMRKLLEKNSWSLPLAYRILECYDSVKHIDECDRKVLGALFTYPEKFWKIANYYYNSNKALMPEKNMLKLCNLINQNENRKRFVKTLG